MARMDSFIVFISFPKKFLFVFYLFQTCICDSEYQRKVYSSITKYKWKIRILKGQGSQCTSRLVNVASKGEEHLLL